MGARGGGQRHWRNTPEPPTDIQRHNYALTLQHLEAVFYTQGLKRFDENDFGRYFETNRPYRRQGIEELEGEGVRREFVLIREHEQIHVKTFRSVIWSLGGKPVPECTYNFKKTAFTSPGKFLSVARLLENTGVSANDGAVAHIRGRKTADCGRDDRHGRGMPPTLTS